jgi:hypothetical protein
MGNKVQIQIGTEYDGKPGVSQSLSLQNQVLHWARLSSGSMHFGNEPPHRDGQSERQLSCTVEEARIKLVSQTVNNRT